MTTQHELAPVAYEASNGDAIQLTPADVRRYLVRGDGEVSEQELAHFLQLCRFQRLNPWLKEAYLIKYGSNQPATMVVGKDVFFKRAEADPQFDGIESGLYVRTEAGELVERSGSFKLPGDEVLGGWAKVYRKDRRVPVEAHVSIDEYAARRKDGTYNRQWSEKPATMITKVAKVQALRECFTETLGALYESTELQVDDAPPRDVTPPAPDPAELQKLAARRAEMILEVEHAERDGVITSVEADKAVAALERMSSAGALEHQWQIIANRLDEKRAEAVVYDRPGDSDE